MHTMKVNNVHVVASVLILVASFAATSDAHGLVTMPPMRTAFSRGEDNPHGYSGGGAAANAGGRTYEDKFPPVGTAPACGKSNAMSPGPVTAMDVSGGILNVEVTITTNHWGKICFHLFTDPSSVNSYSGFIPLNRADGAGNCVFPPLENGNDGNGMFLKGEADNSNFRNGFGLVYRVPLAWPGISCPHCVLHMHWTTGHSCTPPGIPPGYVKSYAGWPVIPCGPTTGMFPEMFFNCADFTTTGKSVAAASTNATGTTGYTAGTNTTAALPAAASVESYGSPMAATVPTTAPVVPSPATVPATPSEPSPAAVPATPSPATVPATPSPAATTSTPSPATVPATPAEPSPATTAPATVPSPAATSTPSPAATSSAQASGVVYNIQLSFQCGSAGSMPFTNRCVSGLACFKNVDEYAQCRQPSDVRGDTLLYVSP